MGGKYKVQNIKEFADLLLSIYNAGENALADGKLGAADTAYLLGVIPKVAPAIKDMDKIPKEAKELDKEDAAELKQFIADATNRSIKDKNVVQDVNAVLSALVALSQLYTALKTKPNASVGAV